MRKSLFCSIVLGLMLIPDGLITAQDSQPPSGSGLAQVLKPFVDGNVTAGCVTLVADKNRVLDLDAVGYANIPNQTPMEVNDMFYLASTAKCFTGATFMMLVDDGKVSIGAQEAKIYRTFLRAAVDKYRKEARTAP